MHKIAILPTLLTLGNAVCGFASIAIVAQVIGGGARNPELHFLLGGVLIFVAMIFDALDGYAARLSKSASDFGKELDSLCDAISFGVAPGILLLALGADWGATGVTWQAITVIGALYAVDRKSVV